METSSLRKILELEKAKGFSDKTVIGGMDKFMRNWADQAAASISDKKILARFTKLRTPDYKNQSPDQRAKWAQDILSFLSELESPQVIRKPVVTSSPKPRRIAVVKRPENISGAGIELSVSVINGVGEAMTKKFNKLGLKTVRDLLYYFPNRHVDYSHMKTVSQLDEGKEESIIANVWEAREVWLGGRRSTEATLGDATGNVRAVWFNNPYLVRTLKPNSRIVLSGRVRLFHGRPVFESPEWEPLEEQDLVHTGRLVPVYPLTEGLYQRQLRKIIKSTVDKFAASVPEFLPDSILRDRNLVDLPTAIAQAHFPDDLTLQDKARVRLAFDELFLLQLG
ncbi:MAG TPA: DNA helicase RecG, partial [Dehalococcoidales bacterium]|nr:DNA helicase RecG [Dehalococcoidales bacterium]